MSSDEKSGNDRSPKGFAGLSSQVSDIDAEIAHANSLPPVPISAVQRAGHSEQPLRLDEQSDDQSPKNSGSSVKPVVWWGIGAAVLGIIWFASQSGTGPASSSPPAAYADEQSPPEITVEGQAPAAPQALTEERPPVGYGLEHSVGQIRYCLAEKIRISAAEPVVNSYNSAQVDRFNAMVSDYNSRCGQYRYLDSSMSLARSEVEAHRAELEKAGRDLIKKVGGITQPSVPTDVNRGITGSNPGVVPYGGIDASDPLNAGADGSATDDENGPTEDGGGQND
jgi:hypothetical protein